MYPRIEVRLTSWQRQRLQQLRDQPPTPRVGKRAVCLLLSAEGVSNQLIAQATGLAPDTLAKIRRRWNERGMVAVKDAPRSGRPPKVNSVYRKELKDALGRGPLAYGYVFTTWSIARLNAHLHHVTGIRICNDWLRQLVHAEGFVYRRPKHTLQGAPVKGRWDRLAAVNSQGSGRSPGLQQV